MSDSLVTCPRCQKEWHNLVGEVCIDCHEDDRQKHEAEQGRLRTLAQIPDRYHPALDIPPYREWGGEPWSVVFQGPHGTGKTWNATRLWAEVATPGSRWVSGQELARSLRASIGNPDAAQTAGEILAELARCPVLLLDDMQAVRGTDFLVESLQYLICARYDWSRPTLFTMDQPVANLKTRIDSRLHAGWIFVLDGQDRRKS